MIRILISVRRKILVAAFEALYPLVPQGETNWFQEKVFSIAYAALNAAYKYDFND